MNWFEGALGWQGRHLQRQTWSLFQVVRNTLAAQMQTYCFPVARRCPLTIAFWRQPLTPRWSGQHGRGWLGGGLPSAERGGAWRTAGGGYGLQDMEVLCGLLTQYHALETLFVIIVIALLWSAWAS
jgi:hypothetical protein